LWRGLIKYLLCIIQITEGKIEMTVNRYGK
jgi:hypothetical protein